MKKPFKYYLHDDSNSWERAEFMGRQLGMELTETQVEKLGRPFYEVTLLCEFDTETSEVTIVGVEQ